MTQNVTVREGEKARTIAIKFADAPKAKVETRPLVPVSSIVLGAVGVVSIGVFTVYHLSAKSDLDAMRSSCAPRCSSDAVDTFDHKVLVSNVALGVGLSAIAGAALVFFLEGGWRGYGASQTGRAKDPLVVRF